MRRSDPNRSLRPSWARHGLWSLWRLALAGLFIAALVTGCPDEADDDSADDDDAADDDTSADDDASDDDIWDDDASDDDASDDDGGDDDASGDACPITFGPPEMPFVVNGTCQPDPGMCDGGFDMMNPAGDCTGGMTCCIHTDQCEFTLMAYCVADPEDCDEEPPPQGQFPMFGCPPNIPICCLGPPPR